MSANKTAEKEIKKARFTRPRDDGSIVDSGALSRQKGETDEAFFSRMKDLKWLSDDPEQVEAHWSGDNQAYHAGQSDSCLLCRKATKKTEAKSKAQRVQSKANPIRIGAVKKLKSGEASVLFYFPSEIVEQISNTPLSRLTVMYASDGPNAQDSTSEPRADVAEGKASASPSPLPKGIDKYTQGKQPTKAVDSAKHWPDKTVNKNAKVEKRQKQAKSDRYDREPIEWRKDSRGDDSSED